MNHPDYNSSIALKNFMEEHGFSMQKKFGQNFLLNENARVKIVDALELEKDMSVWEVGPGLGAMTNEILKREVNLTVFEIDKGFSSLLPLFFEEYIKSDKLKIVEGDVLKTWKKNISQTELPNRFFGNLPYNIAATLIADTIENNVRFEKCVFTVQKEVAKRMNALPGSDDYSSFSVICSWAYDITNILDLRSMNFWPKPNVDSRVVLFTKKKNFPQCENPNLFCQMQRALFSSRRKTVKNNLTAFLASSQKADFALDEAKINPQLRAEVLALEQMLLLSDIIYKNFNK